MGRPRTKDRHLPERVYFEEGRYRYKPKGAKPVELGTDFAEAMKLYGETIAPTLTPKANPVTMGDWGDTYMLKVVPLKAPRTQRDNKVEWGFLRPAFADVLPEDVDQPMMSRYLAARGAITRGNREKALLSHMLSWLVFLGKLKLNPLFNMQRKFSGNQEMPRTRSVTDRERNIFVRHGGAKIVAYLDLKELTRMRKGDLLTLELSNLKDDCIEIVPRKSRRRHPRTGEVIGKKRQYTITPDVRAVLDRILEIKRAQELRTRKITPWLFATEKGKCYYDTDRAIATGFYALWRRVRVKATKAAAAEGWVLERFTEHDLRARKGGSAKLLGNSEDVYKKHYDRDAEVVEPLRKPS